MLINDLKRSEGLNKKAKRRGRGDSSGRGNYSTRGLKGQGSRSGSSSKPWFEGGQTPLNLRLPKLKGFKRPADLITEYIPVNLSRLEKDDRIISGATIDKKLLKDTGYIKKETKFVKLLGTGDITKKLNFVGIEKFSETAKSKIEKAGGQIS